MNKRPFLILSLFLLLFSFGGQAADTYRPETSVAGFIPLPDCGRQVYNFNPGWRFFKGDIRGAEAVNFDDRSWEVVSTPHTVELMPRQRQWLPQLSGSCVVSQAFCSSHRDERTACTPSF